MLQRTRTVIGSMAVATALFFAGAGAAHADGYWQCAPFARLISGIQIFGDAWTWWGQAAGKYATGFSPKAGAVLVFRPSGAMRLGHVAVVSQVLTDRVIQITHANWSRIGGTRGQVEKDVTVVDVSPAGDWSQVKVWYDPLRDLGSSTYPTYGFIYQAPNQNPAQAVARNAAMTVAQATVNQVASGAPTPGRGPAQALGQAAADTGDRLAAFIQSVMAAGDSKSGAAN